MSDHPPLVPLPSTPKADLRQGRGNELVGPPLADKAQSCIFKIDDIGTCAPWANIEGLRTAIMNFSEEQEPKLDRSLKFASGAEL